MVFLLASASLPASGCIAGMEEQEFEPQSLGSGPAILQLTPITANTAEEMFPVSAVFKDKLYVAWQREDFNETVKYFATLASFDGESWSEPLFLSSPDITKKIRSELNLNPRMAADDDALYVAWASNEPDWTEGMDDDIVFRFTEDGETWSEVIEVSGYYNEGLDKLPRVVPYDERVFFIWETTDRIDSDGPDMDIVMRSWDGSGFGQVLEVTPSGDSLNDHHVDAVASDGLLYFTWMRRAGEFSNDFEIWGRVFDGADWVTEPFKVSSDASANNEHPCLVTGGGAAFFVWETYDTGSSDPTSIVVRKWTQEAGLGPIQIVSSITSKGRDSNPAALWWKDSLYVNWISMDQGVTFGSDPDVIYRIGKLRSDGLLHFEPFQEVSDFQDDYRDQKPHMVVYDDILFSIWNLDVNLTEWLRETNLTLLEELGGVFRSNEVAIKALEIPFEKQLQLVYSLGTAIPTATKPTTADIIVTDLEGGPVTEQRVAITFGRVDSTEPPRRLPLDEDKPGVYQADELEFDRDGTYEITIIVENKKVGSFIVDVDAPPPSFVDRVPWAAVVFLAAGVVSGTLLYRMMGRDERIEELRPAPLEASSPGAL
jgi:hypothetical protein